VKGLSPPCQPIVETTNIMMVVSEKKTRKTTTKKTKTIPVVAVVTPDTLTSQATTSERKPDKLVVTDILPTEQARPVAKLPSELVVKRLLGTLAPCQTIPTYVPSSPLPINSPSESANQPEIREDTTMNVSPLPASVIITKKQTTKKSPANKKTKRGKLNSTIDNKRNETPPTLQIANIILHLKCSVNDLDVYNDEVNRQLTDPMLYNPSVPPDIMTYQPAEHYSVLEETKPSNNTLENYAYSESKNRVTCSNKFREI
jgi:hypothetical protein